MEFTNPYQSPKPTPGFQPNQPFRHEKLTEFRPANTLCTVTLLLLGISGVLAIVAVFTGLNELRLLVNFRAGQAIPEDQGELSDLLQGVIGIRSKLLAFAGSTRKGSYNQKLIEYVAKKAEEAGAKVTLIHLSDYELPIYSEDLESEQGIPENALELKKLFGSNDGLLIASPEYNSSLSPLLKNVIDWVSRKSGDEGPIGIVPKQGRRIDGGISRWAWRLARSGPSPSHFAKH